MSMLNNFIFFKNMSNQNLAIDQQNKSEIDKLL
jgi:hypothetical protein